MNIMVKASDLVKEQKDKDESKKKYYKKIYKRIEKKIINISSVNEYKCWFEIPEFILGVPLYSFNECKNYLINKLQKDGFKVSMISQNILLIDWTP